MIFLQGPYEWVAASLESSVNHFPLIQLVFNSVDKTILYYLIWLVLRAAYLLHRHRKTGKKIAAEEFKSVRTVNDVVEAVYRLVCTAE